MPKLAGCPSLSAVNLTVKNNACAYAFSNEHQDKVPRIAHLWTAKPKFGERNGIGVVVDNYGQAKRCGNGFGDRNIAPFEKGNVNSGAGRGINQARQANADCFDLTFVLEGEFPNQSNYFLQSFVWIRISQKFFLLDYSPGQIARRDCRTSRRDGHTNSDCFFRSESQQSRPAASGRFALAHFFNQAFSHQRFDDCRDG